MDAEERRPEEGRARRPTAAVAGWAVAAVAVVVAVVFVVLRAGASSELADARADLSSSQQRVQELERENEELSSELDRLEGIRQTLSSENGDLVEVLAVCVGAVQGILDAGLSTLITNPFDPEVIQLGLRAVDCAERAPAGLVP